MSYSKSWSIKVSLGVDLIPFTFGGSFSYGESKTTSTATTSFLYMRKRYAQGGMFINQKYLSVTFFGNIKLQVKNIASNGVRRYMNVSLNLKGK